ncbi:MAG TPA: hypothetical protein VFF13_03375 [archaeon]|nr:hypothetical protein [archaeon]
MTKSREIEPEVKESYMKKLLRIEEGMKKRGDKPQTVQELRREIES